MTIFDLMDSDTGRDIVETVLLEGSHVVNGKTRIYEYGSRGPGLKQFADMLRSEYGVGGWLNDNLYVVYDGKGIEIKHGDEVTTLLWEDVAKKVSGMIESGIFRGES